MQFMGEKTRGATATMTNVNALPSMSAGPGDSAITAPEMGIFQKIVCGVSLGCLAWRDQKMPQRSGRRWVML